VRSNVATPAGSPYAGNDRADAGEQDEPSEREDLLDQHVAYYLKHHPEVNQRHNLHRVRPGVYNFNGREISVEWHYADTPGEQGFLICIDGPLRQPFADYMQDNENCIEYDDKRLGKSALSQIPKGKRLSFGDSNKVYSRLEAMKVAKEQALVREKAADYMNDGMVVPQQELMSKYKKTLSQKLGERRQSAPERAPDAQQPPAPAASPVACMLPEAAMLPSPPPAGSPTASPMASPGAGSEKAARTHGAPKYCANHDHTTKRKKTKPHNEPCVQCQTVIQTNYVQFKLCPGCSEKDHRCMCCGSAAVGPAPSPKASEATTSPMHAPSPAKSNRAQSKSSAQSPVQQMSPMNLFGMPDLMGGRPAPTQMPQGNVFASNNAFSPQNAIASPNMYTPQNTPQNGYASYNPMAQNMMAGRPF